MNYNNIRLAVAA